MRVEQREQQGGGEGGEESASALAVSAKSPALQRKLVVGPTPSKAAQAT